MAKNKKIQFFNDKQEVYNKKEREILKVDPCVT